MGVRAASLTRLTLTDVPGARRRGARRDRRHDVRRVRAALPPRLVRAGGRHRPGRARLRDAVRQGARGVRRADRPPPVGGVHGRQHRDRAAGDAAADLQGRGRAAAGKDFAREVALARKLCADKGMQIGLDGVQLLGGHGFVKEHPVERWYRDLRAIGVMEGACSSDDQPRRPEEAPDAGRPGPPGRDEHAAADLAQVRPRRARVPQGARHARRDDRRALRVRRGEGAGAVGRRDDGAEEPATTTAASRTAPTSPRSCRSPRCAGATSACCCRCRARASATRPSRRSRTTSRPSASRASGPRWRSPSPAPAPTRPTSGRPPARRRRVRAQRREDLRHLGRPLPTRSSCGRPLDKALGRAAIKSFVVPKGTPGMSVERLEHKLGIRASDTATIRFEDCRVPAENLLGSAEVDPKQGFAGAMATFDNTRPLVAAMAVGCARASLDLTRELLEQAGVAIDYDRPASPSPRPRPGSCRWRPTGRPRTCSRCRRPGWPTTASPTRSRRRWPRRRPAGSAPTSRSAASSWPARWATARPSCSRSGRATPRSSTSSRAPSRSSS